MYREGVPTQCAVLIVTSSGQLRNIAKLRYWGLKDVLTDKYLLDPEEAAKLASFLLPMVCLSPYSLVPVADQYRLS